MTKRKQQHEYKLTVQQRLLGIHLDELGVSFEREVKFCGREWRLDLVVSSHNLAIEISGGNWTGGHRRGHAQEDEYEKLNHAQLCGYRVLQFTNDQVECGHAKEIIARFL